MPTFERKVRPPPFFAPPSSALVQKKAPTPVHKRPATVHWSPSRIPPHAPSGPGSAPAPGRGQPLGPSEREYFEPRFGRDLGGVRIHTGPGAASSARAQGARAYTTGEDIVFGEGEYAPSSPEGRRLLAHELTHTVQQSTSPGAGAGLCSSSGLPVSAPGDRAEVEADRVADAVVAGRSAGAVGAAPAAIARAAAHPSSGFKTGEFGNWSWVAFLDLEPAKMRLRWFDSNQKDETREIGLIPWVTNNPGNIRTTPGDPNEKWAAATQGAYQKRPGPGTPVGETKFRGFEVFASEAEGSKALVPFLQRLISFNTKASVEGILRVYRFGPVPATGPTAEQVEYIDKITPVLDKLGSPVDTQKLLKKLGTAATADDLEKLRQGIEFLEGSKQPGGAAAPTGPSPSSPGMEYICGTGWNYNPALYTPPQIAIIDALKAGQEAAIKLILSCP